ncbi:hypothetical protein LWM68_20690 [Niabella sp. W65]|nr:hypothetical protein [Niabella sp. W65]MCH7364964.1 hypothetical protein [Niabella sp. W65]
MFQDVNGVEKVTSGYTDGNTKTLLMKRFARVLPGLQKRCRLFTILLLFLLMSYWRFSGKLMIRPRLTARATM